MFKLERAGWVVVIASRHDGRMGEPFHGLGQSPEITRIFGEGVIIEVGDPFMRCLSDQHISRTTWALSCRRMGQSDLWKVLGNSLDDLT